jgi:hypothetical protein
MGRVFEAINNFFHEDDWPITELEGKTVLKTGFSGDNGQWTCFAQAREEQEQFVFYSVCPLKVPEGVRDAVAEFLTRANYGLLNGNFEMDYDDGEVRYKTFIDVEGGELPFAMIKTLVYGNVFTMDKYFPGLMKVIYGDVSPSLAITEIES